MHFNIFLNSSLLFSSSSWYCATYKCNDPESQEVIPRYFIRPLSASLSGGRTADSLSYLAAFLGYARFFIPRIRKMHPSCFIESM